jgi:hypothetical protein
MQRKRFIFLLILLTSAVFTSLEAGADPGLALARSLSFRTQNCVPESTKPGFNLGGENRGSSVTLCAKFIVDKTVLKPNPRPKPSVLPVSSGANTVEPKKTKPDHRRMVSKSGNTFSPSASPIMATPKTVKPRQPVKLQISSSRQYRTAYLLGKFVALRFTPLRAELHLNPQSRSKIKTTGPFSADLTISRSGTWQDLSTTKLNTGQTVHPLGTQWQASCSCLQNRHPSRFQSQYLKSTPNPRLRSTHIWYLRIA